MAIEAHGGTRGDMKKPAVCLWFGEEAEQAAKFYVSVFRGAKMGPVNRCGEETSKAAPIKKGCVMVAAFKLKGQDVLCINGKPSDVKFTDSVSIGVPCKDQKEIDRYWKKLTQGGKEIACGWLKDKYGVTWQFWPASLDKMMKNKKGYDRMLAALCGMIKPDINALEKAYRGR